MFTASNFVISFFFSFTLLLSFLLSFYFAYFLSFVALFLCQIFSSFFNLYQFFLPFCFVLFFSLSLFFFIIVHFFCHIYLDIRQTISDSLLLFYFTYNCFRLRFMFFYYLVASKKCTNTLTTRLMGKLTQFHTGNLRHSVT